ncbi:MAG: hypothetical protein CVU36_12865 [Betaproteobacteria bacterium HGW-Betaproteobacteria-9]|jgi:hypothetical protein|nr:MAG: hypothetical protein CVU36_12865 [Betaproteobacteria bacterium HGW-Betaproteobacteria-9]
MTTHIRHAFKLVGLSLAIAVLTACGGNDDPKPGDTSGDPVAKYIGSWESACYEDSGASAHLRADFTKASATGFTGEVVAYLYIGTSCSGPSVKNDKVFTNMVMNHDGTKIVGSVTADKFAGTSNQGSAKVLLHVNGNTLQIGDPDASKDAQGYPNAFYDKTMSRI